jgi:hypothetical protein
LGRATIEHRFTKPVFTSFGTRVSQVNPANGLYKLRARTRIGLDVLLGSSKGAKMPTKYQVQLFDADTRQPIQTPIPPADQPYTFGTGDYYLFAGNRLAPIRRVAHAVVQKGQDVFYQTLVFVGRPGTEDDGSRVVWPEKLERSGDDPIVPWPW